ncbi:peptidylprolyl isomerase [Lujinxingia litoralis]|uniref:peptidylprolyl isomerase n=1 Tax=Lujinxingia litoralis TaxID=2211119 RepID=A0A328C3X7_9DELT|nr:peptidylprolyl isomerase [Lujinxingia litoralis]RAL20532.1 peptidylprolyl isomerase [Lujinxingia litoralis]
MGLAYKVCDECGELVEEVGRDRPRFYIHGYEQILPALEHKLSGLHVGEKFCVTLKPGEAFGRYEERLCQRVPRWRFPSDVSLVVGARLELGIDDHGLGIDYGTVLFCIKEVGADEVVVDGNHPLAGRELTYRGEIVEVRVASYRELEAMGPQTLPHGLRL